MRAFPKIRILTCVIVAMTLSLAGAPQVFADDTAKADTSPASRASAPQPAEKSAGLTERERILLERVEQLEKRVEELESKAQPSSPATPSAVSAAPAAAPESAAATVVAPSATIVGTSPGTSAAAATAASATDGAAHAPDLGTSTSAAISQPAAINQLANNPKTKAEPFAFADWTWLTGNPRTKDTPWDTKFFTPEFRADINYVYDFNHPKDDTIGGSSEVFRSNEVHVTDLGVGGDFHYDNVRGRVLSQIGLYSQTTARNDASPARGQWNLADAYRYVSEAYGGYHFNVLHGVNVDAGIFLSYIGLFSYYQFDNWTYQPSFVSSNTPWFFNGLRVQVFPTDKLKIEGWFVNGWQSYGRFNNRPGLGVQIAWRPNGKVSIVAN